MPRDESYLEYMLKAIAAIEESLSGITRRDFDSNREKRDSIVLQIANIGEAASHVSEQYRNTHSAIPWGRVIGMRHRIFHGYHRVDWDVVWGTATQEVPELKKRIRELLQCD